MSRWIAYSLKAWRFEKWYGQALNRRCDRADLNLRFDDIAFCNGIVHASSKSATRRYGNLRYNQYAPRLHIGFRIPPRVTQDQKRRLKDETYALEHAELLDAMQFWAEKREKRRGRRDARVEEDY
jgi:hypothetical protein